MRVVASNAQTNKMWGRQHLRSDRILSGKRSTPTKRCVFTLRQTGADLQIELFDGYQVCARRHTSAATVVFPFNTNGEQARHFAGFESSRSDNYKGDREMTIREMQRKYAVNASDLSACVRSTLGFFSRTGR
jgi:hypothetical protein